MKTERMKGTDPMPVILIVEDEKKIARFLELELKHEGYDVLTAFDGRSGLETAMEKDPDLMILDLNACDLTDISFLRAFSSLQELYLGHNSITDLSPLRGHDALEYLDLRGNPIRDYSFITQMGIETLYMDDGTETDTETGADTGNGTETGTDTEIDTGTGINTGSETGIGTDSGNDAGDGTDTWSGGDSEPGIGTDDEFTY